MIVASRLCERSEFGQFLAACCGEPLYVYDNMFGFHEKRKLRGIIYSKGAIVLLGAVTVFMSVVVWSSYSKEYDTRVRKNEQQAGFGELSKRAEELRSEISRLQSAAGVEAEVRDKYGVRLPGEELIVIIEPDAEESLQVQPRSRSLWSRIRDLF
jgi:cell division protein FtsB